MTDSTIPFRPVVRSQSDLETAWKHLMGPPTRDGGFGGHSLWLLVIEDDHPFPQITEITEAVEPPDEEMVASVATFLSGLAGEGRRFAFLRSRPGHGGLTADDRAWARSVRKRRCSASGGRGMVSARNVLRFIWLRPVLPCEASSHAAQKVGVRK